MAYSPFALCVVVVVVCVLLAISVATAYERAGYGYVLRGHVSKTCHPNVHYGWLLGVRVIGFLYCLGVLIYDIVLWGPFIYEYYTQWSFTLLIIYLGVAIGSSLKEIRRERSAEQRDVLTSNERLLGGYQQPDEERGPTADTSAAGTYYNPSDVADTDGYVMQILYQVILGAAFVTDIVYWIFIFPSSSSIDFVDISMHAVNLVVLLADVALNNMVCYWFRGSYFLIYSAIFIFATWIFHACGENVWPYSFLDVSVDLAPLWYFLLCLVHLFAYALVWGVIALKDYSFRRFQPTTQAVE